MNFEYRFGDGLENEFGNDFGSTFGSGLRGFGQWLRQAAPGLIAVLLVIAAIVAVFAIAVYVLRAIGLYTMAKRRGLANPWLAWIPVADQFLLGAVADDITRLRGRRTNYSIILLVLSASGMVVSCTAFAAPLAGFITWPVSIAMMVFLYMAVYEIFKDYAPQNAVLFLVLSVLLSLYWVFLFVIRNRRPVTLGGNPDGSQPPRGPSGWQSPAGPAAPTAPANWQNPAGPAAPTAPANWQNPAGPAAPAAPSNWQNPAVPAAPAAPADGQTPAAPGGWQPPAAPEPAEPQRPQQQEEYASESWNGTPADWQPAPPAPAPDPAPLPPEQKTESENELNDRAE